MNGLAKPVVAALVSAMLYATTIAAAQTTSTGAPEQPRRIARIGFISPVARATGTRTTEAFRQGLADLGYIDGKNIAIEERFADGKFDQVPELTLELLGLKVDVIAILGAVTVRAARKAAGNTPIVFGVVVDPLGDDLVANAEHPGGNITGVTTFDPQQARKQLDLLKEVIPGVKRVAFIGDAAVSDALMKVSEEQARALGLQGQRVRLSGPNADLEAAFAAIRNEHADAVIALEEPAVGSRMSAITQVAAKYRIPVMSTPLRADAGLLLAYGTSLLDGMRAIAPYIDKILKGAKPADLPVTALTRYKLIVNLKTARQIGVTIPPEVLKRADRVIE